MIRQATKADIVRCLDEHIASYTGLNVTDIDHNQFLAVEQDGAILCALIYTKCTDAEVHLMCPRASALKSRDLCREIIGYLAATGIKTIYTSSTGINRRADNLAKRLGFTEITKGVYALEV